MARRPRAATSRPILLADVHAEEVDLVVERTGDLLGIEVKAGIRPRAADVAHLKSFRDEYGDQVRGCLLLHGGQDMEWLGPQILAAPWWRVI
jgi:hypothetical protein